MIDDETLRRKKKKKEKQEGHEKLFKKRCDVFSRDRLGVPPPPQPVFRTFGRARSAAASAVGGGAVFGSGIGCCGGAGDTCFTGVLLGCLAAVAGGASSSCKEKEAIEKQHEKRGQSFHPDDFVGRVGALYWSGRAGGVLPPSPPAAAGCVVVGTRQQAAR